MLEFKNDLQVEAENLASELGRACSRTTRLAAAAAAAALHELGGIPPHTHSEYP